MNKSILFWCENHAKNINRYHPEWGYFLHYSFFIQKNKVIEIGLNRKGPAPKVLGYPDFGTLHSEIMGYRKARGILDKRIPFEVVNIRLNKKGELRNSKPCKCCHEFLLTLNCNKIYYSTDNGFEVLRMG